MIHHKMGDDEMQKEIISTKDKKTFRAKATMDSIVNFDNIMDTRCAIETMYFISLLYNRSIYPWESLQKCS